MRARCGLEDGQGTGSELMFFQYRDLVFPVEINMSGVAGLDFRHDNIMGGIALGQSA